MTVSYSSEVSLKKRLCNFLRLLRRWKGSIYKLVYKELMLYWLAYFALYFLYRFGCNQDEKEGFMYVCIFCKQYSSLVPLTFILGFYVNMVIVRWWNIYNTLPRPDKCRLIRRTLMRWLNAAAVMTARSVSLAAKKRYPSMMHLVSTGLLNEQELKEIDKFTYPSHRFWVPIKWSIELIGRARLEGRMANNRYVIELVNEINCYRRNLQKLLDYDWISVPLVYTQVVTLAVYGFFFSLLFSRQYMGPDAVLLEKELSMLHDMSLTDTHQINDPFSPVLYTTLQFLFYMGWLKVAEILINPLGLDDDDFEINWIIDRNIKFSFLIVDGMLGHLPALQKDIHWDDKEKDIDIPYTEGSVGVKDAPPITSQHKVKLTQKQMEIVPAATPTSRGPEMGLGDSIKEKDTPWDKIASKLGLGSQGKLCSVPPTNVQNVQKIDSKAVPKQNV